jgi:hypothetical protein
MLPMTTPINTVSPTTVNASRSDVLAPQTMP